MAAILSEHGDISTTELGNTSGSNPESWPANYSRQSVTSVSDLDEQDTAELEDGPLISPATQILRSNGSPSPLSTSQQSLTYFNCLSIVLGIQIGAGIFSTPAMISRHVTTPIAGVLVWTLAGFLVWTGACCFIELGTLLSHNGGIQEYLRAGYGDVAGFMFSLTWLSMVRPCTIAIIAMIFAEHMGGLVSQQLGSVGNWFMHKTLALTAVWLLTVINCLGLKTGAKVAGWFLVLKLSMLISIISVGIYECIRMRTGFLFTGPDTTGTAGAKISTKNVASHPYDLWDAVGEYVTATLSALWVYGGWESVGFIAGEMKNPVRDIPRVLNSAMSIVITSFTLTSASFYVVLPISRIRENDTPATTFANTIFGHSGFLLYTIGISLSAIGAVNANIFAISRLVVSASRRGYIPAFFATNDDASLKASEEVTIRQRSMGKRRASWLASFIMKLSSVTTSLRSEGDVPVYEFKAPSLPSSHQLLKNVQDCPAITDLYNSTIRYAMLLNSILTSVYILTGTFQALLTFIGLVEYIVFMFTVFALLRLRRDMTIPKNSAPAYRTYTANIILFILLSCLLVLRGVVVQPMQGVMIFTSFAGLYGTWRWKLTRHGDPDHGSSADELVTMIHTE